MTRLSLNPGRIHLNFKRLIHFDIGSDKKYIEKKYFKLLALGISDFNEMIKVWERITSEELKTNKPIKSNDLDLFVYEYLSNNTIKEKNFSAKHVLALTQIKNNSIEPEKAIEKLEKIFPQKIDVSSMTPSPIHFGPLEGFLSGSISNIDLKTLLITVGFWFSIYGIIIYYFYF